MGELIVYQSLRRPSSTIFLEILTYKIDHQSVCDDTPQMMWVK